MAGLLDSVKQNAPDGVDQLIEQAPDLSPAEEQQLNELMPQVEKMFLDDQAYPAMLKMIASAPDKVDAAAQVIIGIGEQLMQMLQKAGKQISPDVLAVIAIYLLARIDEHASNAGAAEYSDEELGDILAKVLSEWHKLHPEQFDTEDIAQNMTTLPEPFKDIAARSATEALVPTDKPDIPPPPEPNAG